MHLHDLIIVGAGPAGLAAAIAAQKLATSIYQDASRRGSW